MKLLWCDIESGGFSDKKSALLEVAIIPVIDGDWIRAERTTLGADDGIGIAAQMAVLTQRIGLFIYPA